MEIDKNENDIKNFCFVNICCISGIILQVLRGRKNWESSFKSEII